MPWKKNGFERCLKEVEEEVPIQRIATDRHVFISSTMNKNHTHISHQYDVWHLPKSTTKKLSKKANLEGNEDLLPWRSLEMKISCQISNHLWWCSSSCNQNAEELVEKWKSVLCHLTNKHKWTGNTFYHGCCHPSLTDMEQRKKKWLSPTSQSYIVAEAVILEKVLKDLTKLTEFYHTGQLEVYHSLLLKYCPKREHFSFNGMGAHTQLAAIDHNDSERKQAILKSGPQ